MDLIANCSTPCLNQVCWALINTWLLVPFYLFYCHLNLKGTRRSHNWLCCMYFSLPNNINSKYIQQRREMFPPPGQNTITLCDQFTLLVLYYFRSRLVTLLNVTDAHIQVSGSDIFDLIVSSSSILAFRRPTFFMSPTFTFYTV
jgi:hypothetical protein